MPLQVCLRYYPGAPLALKLVSVHLKDTEKVRGEIKEKGRGGGGEGLQACTRLCVHKA